MTDIPPSRYQVVERGRRLVVIDRASGQEVSHVHPTAPPGDTTAPMALKLSEKIRFDGGAVLNTHSLYDEKAPRTITLDPASAALIGRMKLIVIFAAMLFVLAVITFPVALGLVLLVLNAKLRSQVRARITAWLDVRARENG